MVFDFLGDKTKVVIAMAHIGALPGSPLYDADGGVSKLIEGVLKDIEALQTGGVDAIMFGNENDRPYVLRAPPEGLAAMSAVVQAVKTYLKVPFGVNYLWDPLASVAIAAATGAFIAASSVVGMAADATAGQQVFARCAVCHSATPGENKIGPSLAGVFGRKSGSEPGYDYSPALKAANITWDEHTLDQQR